MDSSDWLRVQSIEACDVTVENDSGHVTRLLLVVSGVRPFGPPPHPPQQVAILLDAAQCSALGSQLLALAAGDQVQPPGVAH